MKLATLSIFNYLIFTNLATIFLRLNSQLNHAAILVDRSNDLAPCCYN
ncbi:hypothetical protein CAXC1_190010 [Candidatus Xenohaliotis californiensis]|uniref:Uncharacterized protein n=1 Tax=Candidatus Xenohaliotis californiensis TaxID=84677 RepID=A0ABM9N7H8_9RICK|nr:hypothetical protein CAXC1_190010 [Candidatus Xenohaliotis californiensis]